MRIAQPLTTREDDIGRSRGEDLLRLRTRGDLADRADGDARPRAHLGGEGDLVARAGDDLLVGDETALPAIGRWLEEMPEGRQATVLIEVPEAADRQALATRADATIVWLPRDGTPAHASQRLEQALEEVMPQGDTFWWIACESRRARSMRKFLEGQRQVPKDWIRSTGYWRHAGGEDVDDAAASPAIGPAD